MPARDAESFAFVLADDRGKSKATDRKLIRSHCMRGKNVRKPRLHSHVDGAFATSPQAAEAAASTRSGRSRAHEAGRDSQAGTHVELPAPARSPPDLLLLRYPVDIDYKSTSLLFKFVTVIKHTLYPVELCVDFDITNSLWYQWLFQDATYLHATLMTSSALEDSVRGHSLSHRTIAYQRTTLAMLNAQLSDTKSGTRGKILPLDSTVSVVVSLALMADALGDGDAAAAHVAGLRQMVKLRGGLDNFRQNPQLHIKIGRVDLGWALRTGGNLSFYTESQAWRPQLAPFLSPTAQSSLAADDYSQAIYALLDPKLVAVYRELRAFSRAANRLAMTAGTGERFGPESFLDFMSSVQYRLLLLKGTLEGVVAEAMRLGMLAFVTTSHLQIPGQRLRYPHLADRLREACRAIEPSTPELRHLALWLCVMSAISVFDVADEPWLVQRLVGIVSELELDWEAARMLFSHVLWINVVHDRAGHRVFDAAMAGGSPYTSNQGTSSGSSS